jgi:DNA-binding NtrC family response regulator
MLGTHALQRDERQAGDRQTGDMVGRESEVDRLCGFLATARTDGGAVLVTGEAGVGKAELLDAASDAPDLCREWLRWRAR